MPRRPDIMYMNKADYDDIVKWGRGEEEPRVCAHCGTTGGVRLEDARTAYVREPPTVWDRIRAEDGGLTPTPCVGEDPNAAIYLCRPCAKQHQDRWDDQWAEYYAGLL